MSAGFVKSPAVLLVVAAVFYAGAQYLLAGLETEPAEFPVNLLAGSEFSGDFTAKWDVYYEIRLDSERNLELQKQNCLLGIETIVPEQCIDIPPQLLVSWLVETDNKIIAGGSSGDTEAGYWGKNMGKILGGFPAGRGTNYRVRIKVKESSSILQQTNPKIKIIIRAKDLKWTYVWIGIFNQAAAFCALLATLLLFFLARRHIRNRFRVVDR